MERIFRIAAYIVSVVLLGFYVYVLALGMKPEVSYEYRSFYMDHKLKYMPEEGALTVKPGVSLNLDGREHSNNTFYGIGRGWGWEYSGKAMENTGYCYTTGTESRLYFTNVDPESQHYVHIHTLESETTAKAVEVMAGDVPLGSCEIDALGELVIEIPENEGILHYITDDMNELEIVLCMAPGEILAVDRLVFQ